MTHREVLHSLLHGDTGMPLYAHEVKALTAAIAALDEIAGIRRVMDQVTVPTISALDGAIDDVLGREVAEALRVGHVGRTSMHDMACLRAFAADRRDDAAQILRVLWNARAKTGFYPKESFDDEWPIAPQIIPPHAICPVISGRSG